MNNNPEYNGYTFKSLLVGLVAPFSLSGMQEPDFFYHKVMSQVF